ncbi:hypothetical protein PG993_014068 [Apiospora rasikravindrae]|uniref:Uncharacterized protein n=1 Tax=Apiospora rasikravindrae TaxID=990691 RepID=A0ABR1RS77_9PEZI
MRNHPNSTSGANASAPHDRNQRSPRRHSTVPERRPPPVQRQYVAYRPPPRVVEPQPQRPAQPPNWVNDYSRYSVGGEQESYYATFEHHESNAADDGQSCYTRTHESQSTYSRRTPTPQYDRQSTAPDLVQFQEPSRPAPKKPSFWARLFCDSGSSRATGDGQETRAARPVGPSASTRRRARHAGDEDEPYRVVTGYDADTGTTYYGSRYGG